MFLKARRSSGSSHRAAQVYGNFTTIVEATLLNTLAVAGREAAHEPTVTLSCGPCLPFMRSHVNVVISEAEGRAGSRQT